MIYVVIQKFSDDDYRYCGQPCLSEEEAREVMVNHKAWETDHFARCSCDGTVFYRGIDSKSCPTSDLFLIARMVG